MVNVSRDAPSSSVSSCWLPVLPLQACHHEFDRHESNGIQPDVIIITSAGLRAFLSGLVTMSSIVINRIKLDEWHVMASTMFRMSFCLPRFNDRSVFYAHTIHNSLFLRTLFREMSASTT